MIAWYVPLETFGDTYNGRPLTLAGLASQTSGRRMRPVTASER